MFILPINYNFFIMSGTTRQLKTQEYLENPEKTSISTSDVIVHVEKNGEIVYYLPCYVRFLIKEIKNVDVGGMQGTVTGTLLFSFYYGNTNRDLIDKFVSKDSEAAILLEFNQQEPIQLKEEEFIKKKQDRDEKIINFVIRKSFKTSLGGNVVLTPFETLDMCLSVTIQTVHIPSEQGQPKIVFKFNCMGSSQVDVLSHGPSTEFGYYHIATYYLDAKYTSSRKNPFKDLMFLANLDEIEEEMDQKPRKQAENVKPFHFAHFRIPIYKYPGVTILTVFIPIWILGLIGLIVFFQEPALGGRLGTIATLTLAFVAFLPTINDSIPRSPHLKMVDVLILMQLTSLILLIVESFTNRLSDNVDFDWKNSNLFLASVAFNAITLIIVVGLFLVHKIVWERKYQAKKEPKKITKRLERKAWENKQCDEQFREFASKNKLKNL